MAQPRRRNSDQAVLMALACGGTVEAAARSAGVSTATVFRRLQNPEFCRQLQQIRADMVQRTTGALTAAWMESIKTLLGLQKETVAPTVRLGAARAVLELGMKLREHSDMEERLRALEERLAK